MPIRPLFIYLMFLFGALMAKSSAYGSADNIVYNNCMKEEMAQGMETIVKLCHFGNETEGNEAQCLKHNEAQLSKRATQKCHTQARGAAEEATANLQLLNSESDETRARGCPTPGCANMSMLLSAPVSPPTPAPAPAKTTTPTKTTTTPPLPPRRPPDIGGTATPAKTAAPAQQPTRQQPSTNAKPEPARAAATTSAQQRTPQEPEYAGSSASSDIQMCDQSLSTANRCCGNPTACLGTLSSADQRAYADLSARVNTPLPPPTTQQGLRDYCDQMRSLGGSGSDANIMLSGICSTKQITCSTVCTQLANKYLSLISSCNGCASQYIYEDAYAALSARNSSCNALTARVQQLARPAASASTSAAYGNLCNDTTASNPGMGPGLGGLPSAGMDPNAQSIAGLEGASPQYCARNPNAAVCRAMALAQARKEASGEASFGSNTPSAKAGKGNFNVAPMDEAFNERQIGNFEPQAVSNKTVANNSGGAIPGAGNETSAKLGANPRGQLSPGSPGYSTDILQGMHSGAGYSNPPGEYEPGSRGGGGGGYHSGGGSERGSRDEGGGLIGMDLRQFLPGGSRDPQRRIAGIGSRSQINAKEEDIWRRISNKMVEKCRLGILLGCH